MVLSQKVAYADGFLRRIANDPEGVEIAGAYGASLEFMRKFTRRCWEIEAADLERIREQGVSDTDIVDWIQMGAIQTLAVNQADGGGIFFPEQGSEVIGNDRAYYASMPSGLTAEALVGSGGSPLSEGAAPNEHAKPPVRPTGVCRPSGWLEPRREAASFVAVAEQARNRYGFVPNLLVALSNGRSPSLLPSTLINLKVLEAPQSERITPRQHALVRARTAAASHSNYAEATIRAELEAAGEAPESYRQASEPGAEVVRDAADELIFALAEKAARNAYKITEKDAARFRDQGLGDEAYLDVLGTVGLQLALDRMACATGVEPDEGVLLPG